MVKGNWTYKDTLRATHLTLDLIESSSASLVLTYSDLLILASYTRLVPTLLTVWNRQITCPLSAEPLLGNTRTQRWQGTPYIRSCPQSQSVVDPPPSICISSPACRAPPCASGLATEKNASCLPPTSSTWVTPSLLPVQTPQVREPPLAADSRCRRRRAPHQFYWYE